MSSSGAQMPWAQIRGGGDTISNVPPPPPPTFCFGGRMNFGRYNVVFCLFFLAFLAYILFFFFFLLVRNVRDVGVPPPPPPPLISFFGTCATFGAGGGRENVSVPPTIRFGFAPLPDAIAIGQSETQNQNEKQSNN